MRQIKLGTSKVAARTIAFMLAFAMIATSIAFTPSTSSAKVKVSKVTIFSKTVVLPKGKTMKLKPEVKVTPDKSANKKVSYKSSDSKIVSVSSSGKIKAKGNKGKKAKITITSKKNPKKKVVVTVKIGTRVKSIKLSKSTLTLEAGGEGKMLTVRYTPKKATYRAVKWTSKNSKIASVNPYGGVIPRKAGTTTIVATAKDGSNKRATCTVKVTSASTPTAAPTMKPDPRGKVMVENFESYAVGTKWNLTTGGYVNPATATVVVDPTNKNNKVLKIDYDGATQAYDVAPYFTIDLSTLEGRSSSTVLDDFVGFYFKTKIESNSPDCLYKSIYGYFADAGTIKPEYFFATSIDKAGELYKFKVDSPMAKPVDKEFSDPTTGKKDNYKVFPMYYSDYGDKNDKSAVSPGFVGAKSDTKVPFAERYVEFQKPLIKDAVTGTSLLKNKKVDLIFGSTYAGKFKPRNQYMIMYIDDIQLLYNKTKVGLTGINIKEVGKVGTGLKVKTRTTFVPANTTETGLVWTSSDESIATVDEMGVITGVAPGTVKITATSETSKNVSKSINVTVYQSGTATENLALDISKVTPTATSHPAKYRSEAEAVYSEDGLRINFTKENQSIVIDLGKEMDFTAYKSLEITGRTPGQMGLELYDSSFDKTKDNWWDTSQGATYPFFEGSCATRLEDGAYNTNSADLTQETLRFGWNTLSTGDKKDGDFTKIRYIVLKSNNSALHPGGYSKNNYLIKSIVLSTKEQVSDYWTVALTSLNEAVATSQEKNPANTVYKSFEFGKLENGSNFASFVSNVKRDSGMAFYLDEIKSADQVINQDGAITVAHKSENDISDYKYVKVSVEAASNLLSLVALTNGSDWEAVKGTSGALLTESSYGVEDRVIYFSLKSLSGVDLTKVDALGIKSGENNATVKIKSFDLVKGEPLILEADKDKTYIVVAR